MLPTATHIAVTASDVRNVVDSLIAAALMLMGLFGIRAYKVMRHIIERVEQRSQQLVPNGGGSLLDHAAKASEDAGWVREKLAHLDEDTRSLRLEYRGLTEKVAEMAAAATQMNTAVTQHIANSRDEAAAIRRLVSMLQDEDARIWSALGAHGIHPPGATPLQLPRIEEGP